MKKLIKLLLLTIPLSLISCNNDDDQNPNILPDATQIGANTGGALIDGKVWVSKKEKPNLLPGGNNTEYTFTEGKEYKLRIILNNLKSNGRILLELNDNKDFNVGNYNFVNSTYSNDKNMYHNNLFNNKGSVTITKFDKKNKIVSGTFHFEASNTNGDGTKVIVTEGRFDKEFL